MTTIKEAFQAGIEAGRAGMRYELDALARLDASLAIGSSPAPAAGNGARKHRAAKESGFLAAAPVAPKTPKAVKAKTIARGVRKERGPRTIGVRKGILDLIASETLTTPDIIAKTGFKETSVRGTLAGLEKDGQVQQDENKRWHPMAGGSPYVQGDSASYD